MEIYLAQQRLFGMLCGTFRRYMYIEVCPLLKYLQSNEFIILKIIVSSLVLYLDI